MPRGFTLASTFLLDYHVKQYVHIFYNLHSFEKKLGLGFSSVKNYISVYSDNKQTEFKEFTLRVKIKVKQESS